MGGKILKSDKQKVFHCFGGCPKRKVCTIYKADIKTCIYGPYEYCGRYRSIVEPKSRRDIINEIP